ncbi:hypothetical protein FA95DRAFT_941421 [Auriscalpium vulgare]|uniref:Uncharacterized protein n=1 Tax=Auriscalpium vulgare TaxID=40419 RepID=A0ACB8SB81_9AGAM|nr:hypothetical protein FA95DRAFT_941421 [Auriscalpium vulgare]
MPRLLRPLVASLAVLSGSLTSFAATFASDPCAKIGGQAFVQPADVIACQKSFPLNETIRQNVIATVSGVFDFYTFEDYYLNSPPPFQESTTNIRADLAKLKSTPYATDYDFNLALYRFTTQLNDGHTGWYPSCYISYQNLLPAPIVILDQGVFIVPDLVQFVTLLGSAFTNYLQSIGFNWQRLEGAKVLSIGGMSAFDYIDTIASTVSGNYLDHGVRVNSVVSSYRISGTSFSQRFGDLAGPSFVTQTGLTMTLIPVNSTKPETVTIPYVASFSGNPFTDKASYWANNCAANDDTNGVDRRSDSTQRTQGNDVLRPIGKIVDLAPKQAVALPGPFVPTLPQVNGSTGVIKSYILDDKKTGVMFIGSFEGDYTQFQTDTVAAIAQFQASGVTNLLIDLTDNGGERRVFLHQAVANVDIWAGGYVCLGLFLHQYLSGSKIGYPGFQSTMRANPLAQKIVASNIAQGIDSSLAYYGSDNWAFFNNTPFPANYNYMKPPAPNVVNGKYDPTSQRFYDICTPFQVDVPSTPPFDLSKVALVGNGNCASTCALFTTLMNERHNTKIAIFGGKPGEQVQFKGMAGNQVLEWADLDSEIKTSGLKNDPLAPPDLLVDGNMRVNWRTAWSFFNEFEPIAYVSELPKFQFAYTKDTYNNPQNLWTFAAKQLFH